ncbi:inward rectifier potassium channel irk-1-like [Tribolium madens]|uniref:inward rectifier potassium channel irk-1-like n=1 Tax=Tribolium madens TaxID=41895 RepID=UPI001CF732CB|nr:inward rectifier potassium channel irk-1-like [Tribolium madens]
MYEYDGENDQYNEIFEFSQTSNSRRSSRFSTTSLFSRIISKSGRLNIYQVKIPRKYLNYFRDLGNTLLNTRWRWIITVLCLVNFVSFFLFGLLYMWIAYASGDFETDRDFCIVNTKNLTGYILLSIETMLTIGYGYRYPTEKCTIGWIVPLLQALVSIGIQGVLVSAVYVKIAKPYTKNSLSIFSKKAVVAQRDGEMCLIIRIIDLTEKISIGTNVTMYFINKSQDPIQIKQIKIQPFGCLIFPIEIIHVIDSQSPLWDISPLELLTKPFEIIVVAEGLSVITGQASQNRTSYTNSDLLWGHRFTPCVHFDTIKEQFVINYKNFNKITPFDTPLCSAHFLNSIKLN